MSKIERGYRGIAIAIATPLAFLLCIAATLPAYAQTPQRSQSASAGEPLADALRRFAKESGYDVVFPEHLVIGKYATPVREPRNPYDELTRMLAGSGLVPRFTRRDAFILEAVTSNADADLALDRIEILTSPFEDGEYRWYGDKLLDASLRVLRRSRELGFKTYDFTLFIWLSKDGEIVDLDGFGSAENQETLATAKQMLHGVLVGAVPPIEMPQPVGIRIISQ